MLLPVDVHPEQCIYYNASIILKALDILQAPQIIDLYAYVREENGMTLSIFIFSLDWLYLVQAALIDEGGLVKKCL